jgi:hypothetical protein
VTSVSVALILDRIIARGTTHVGAEFAPMRAGIRAATMVMREDVAGLPTAHDPRKTRRRTAMEAMIVYESMYGNTRAVAEAIGEGWGDGAHVCALRDAAMPPDDLELLVVGGPTQIHGMTTAFSRRLAIDAGLKEGHVGLDPDAVEAPGLRGWLRDLPEVHGCRAAAFDTRLSGSPGKTGAASCGIARRLDKCGYRVEWTESYFVAGGDGPLVDGELDRAHAWGENMRRSITGFSAAKSVGV